MRETKKSNSGKAALHGAVRAFASIVIKRLQAEKAEANAKEDAAMKAGKPNSVFTGEAIGLTKAESVIWAALREDLESAD